MKKTEEDELAGLKQQTREKEADMRWPRYSLVLLPRSRRRPVEAGSAQPIEQVAGAAAWVPARRSVEAPRPTSRGPVQHRASRTDDPTARASRRTSPKRRRASTGARFAAAAGAARS